MDFCVSYAERVKVETFQTTLADILKYFSLNASGQNYMRVDAFKKLKTPLYTSVKQRKDGKKSSPAGAIVPGKLRW